MEAIFSPIRSSVQVPRSTRAHPRADVSAPCGARPKPNSGLWDGLCSRDGSVAQRLERSTHNGEVGGSIPPGAIALQSGILTLHPPAASW